MMHSLDDVDLLHAVLADIAAIQSVGRLVEGTPVRVAEPPGANLRAPACEAIDIFFKRQVRRWLGITNGEINRKGHDEFI